MSQKSKVLDALAMASLPDDAKIARLASQKVGRDLTTQEAKATIRCYFGDWRGRLDDLAGGLVNEKIRQERIRNDRAAIRCLMARLGESYVERRRLTVSSKLLPEARLSERIRHAQNIFGPHVAGNFNDESLALMDLISTDVRSYEVKWLGGGYRPVPCALIEVTVTGLSSVNRSKFLLYKTGDKIMVARTNEKDVVSAWAAQIPADVAESAADLRAEGYSVKSDIEDQSLSITAPNGERKVVYWIGRTVGE